MRGSLTRQSLIVAAVALCAAPAFAADLPVKEPVYKAPAAVMTYNWTGFYIGGSVGYGWGRVKPGDISFFDPATTFAGSIPGIDYNISGVIGGGQIGANYQVGSLVLGVEGDFSGTGIRGSVTDLVNNYTATTEIEWLATGRGRLGVAFDRVLVYGTGGVAIASVKTTLDDVYPSGVITTKSRETHVGWTAGGGVEWAIAPQWTLKAEYLHVDLGSKEHNFNEPSPGWPRISTNASVTTEIVRGGVNFKF